ncbi:MAG: hypothetical protein KC646_12150 [Candidatus Cloacimonetes bacterium]|nr:hypothetical protein [Candidatus Cloacimonadota bacterium]
MIQKLRLHIILFTLFLGLSQSAPKPRMQIKVEALLAVNQVKEARKLILNALKVNSLDPYAMGMNAYMLLVYMQRLNEAQSYTIKSLKIYPKHSLLLHTLAWSFYLQGKFNQSLAVFAKIDPKIRQYELHYHWALAASKAKNNALAIEHFRIARQIQPANHKLLMSIAVFYEQNNQHKKAIQMYQNTLNLLDSKHPARKLLIQKISEKKPLHQKFAFNKKHDNLWKEKRNTPKRPNPIRKPYKKQKLVKKNNTEKNPFLDFSSNQVFRPKPKFQNVETITQKQHYDLAMKLMERNLIKDATLEFHTTINMNPQTSYALSSNSFIKDLSLLSDNPKDRISELLDLSEALFKEAKYQLSLYLLRKILLSEPNNARTQKNMGYLYLHFNKPVISLSILSNLLKEHPKYTEALIIKGYALSKLRRFSEAIQVLTEAKATIVDDNYSKQYVNDLLHQVQSYEDPTQLHLQNY